MTLPTPADARPVTPAGLYIHVPFCVQKCVYCDFYSITDHQAVPAFLTALHREIALAGLTDMPFDSIYIGGGTPSLLGPDAIDALQDAIHRHFRILPGAEVTLEVNPGTIDRDDAVRYRQAGINRISLGVQSFVDRHLAFLGRIHSAAAAIDAIRLVRAAGFDNLSLDLIIGLPGQHREDWTADLARALAFSPEHLSCYILSAEPATPLNTLIDQGRVTLPPGRETAAQFVATADYLRAHGYVHYEVSNFARGMARASRHNRKYWDFSFYRGLGPSAHSYDRTRRYWNHRALADYCGALDAGRLPIEDLETLDRDQQLTEALYLGLRQADGIALDAFEQRFNLRFEARYAGILSAMAAEGYLTLAAGHCRLTTRGMCVLDAIVGRLMANGG